MKNYTVRIETAENIDQFNINAKNLTEAKASAQRIKRSEKMKGIVTVKIAK